MGVRFLPDENLVRHCSPTLAGLKTGSLFSCAFSGQEELKSFLRSWNTALCQKGLRIVPMRWRDGRALIYVFRPEKLKRDLSDTRASQILFRRGYCPSRTGQCVAELIRRLHRQEDFPHEIGLFLGYPPEDVQGFLENRGDCKCTGCWKVYGNVASAQKAFAKYKKCTCVYCRLYAQGRPLERLTVAAQ